MNKDLKMATEKILDAIKEIHSATRPIYVLLILDCEVDAIGVQVKARIFHRAFAKQDEAMEKIDECKKHGLEASIIQITPRLMVNGDMLIEEIKGGREKCKAGKKNMKSN